MKQPELACFENPCTGCTIADLPTEQSRKAAAKAVDYMVSLYTPSQQLSPEGVETLACWAAEEYGVQDVHQEIAETGQKIFDGNCPSRTNL